MVKAKQEIAKGFKVIISVHSCYFLKHLFKKMHDRQSMKSAAIMQANACYKRITIYSQALD
ncbi:hypothetical protein RYU24_18400 [Acinetobacter variabilis]|nr:hypothetical protein RYU24_18400 [Acinetobacter variabilis]